MGQLLPAGARMMSLEAKIRHCLVSFLTGDISLDEFTAWLVGATWNIENTGDVEASNLAYAIELSLAEHSSGLLNLEELQSVLRGLSRHVNLNLTPASYLKEAGDVRVHIGSGARTISPWTRLPRTLSLAGTRSVAASW